MKKYIIALALFALPFVTQASIDKNLYYGLKNDAQVIELQEFLIDNSYLSGSATGNFFSLTLKGIKKFQADNGLPTTGFVGVLTRAEINKKLAMGLAESEEELAKEPVTTPTPSVMPTVPTVPIPTIPVYSSPSPTIQEPTQPTIEAPKPTKEIIVSQERKDDCVSMKVFANDEQGKRIFGTQHRVEITVDTIPNYMFTTNLMNDNTEYTYCNLNGEYKKGAIVKIKIDSFGLEKYLTLDI